MSFPASAVLREWHRSGFWDVLCLWPRVKATQDEGQDIHGNKHLSPQFCWDSLPFPSFLWHSVALKRFTRLHLNRMFTFKLVKEGSCVFNISRNCGSAPLLTVSCCALPQKNLFNKKGKEKKQALLRLPTQLQRSPFWSTWENDGNLTSLCDSCW